MRKIAIMLLQDECDIIEDVLKDALKYFDKIYIYDTGSVDGSLKIIEQLALQNVAIEVIFRKSVIFHEQKTRRHALSLVKDKLLTGDWVIWLDADEFIGLEPSEFHDFLLSTKNGLIRHRHYNFGFTIKELKAFPEYFKYGKKFDKNIYEYYIEYSYAEVKCMRWKEGTFNRLLGGRDFFLATNFSKNRLPILHYPYRNLHQTAKRLSLRNLVMKKNKKEKFNRHWRVNSIDSFIIDNSTSQVKKITTTTIQEDFKKNDGRYDTRLSVNKKFKILTKDLFLKLPLVRDFLVRKKSNMNKEKLLDYEPIIKSKSFNHDLSMSYKKIDVDLIFNKIIEKYY